MKNDRNAGVPPAVTPASRWRSFRAAGTAAVRPPRRWRAIGSAILLLFVSCASSAPKMPPKPMEQLPGAALEMLCTVFKAEGMTSDLRIVKETQSIITPTALQALAQASMSRSQPNAAAAQALLTAPSIPVEATNKACASRFVTPAEAARATDVMILQFSSPGPNPFAKGGTGVFARMTLGGDAATWYWIPLAYRADRWLAGPPIPLAFAE